MENRKNYLVNSLLKALAITVQKTAQISAGMASRAGVHQPKVPAALKK